MKKCVVCGELVPDDQPYCPKCGAAVPDDFKIDPDKDKKKTASSYESDQNTQDDQNSYDNSYNDQSQNDNSYDNTSYNNNGYNNNGYNNSYDNQGGYNQGNPYQDNGYWNQGPYQNNGYGNQDGPYQNSNWYNNGYQNDGNQGYSPYNNPQQPRTDGRSIASLVLGILSLLGGCSVFGGLVMGIIGLVLGIRARSAHMPPDPQTKGDTSYHLAVAGIVCSIIGIIFSALTIVMIIGSSIIGV